MQRATAAAAFVLVLGAVSAHADAIDGDWCSADGRHLRIDGPSIQTPSGARISGDYHRHGFHYVGPTGDPEDGQDIRIVQRSEEEMSLSRKTGADEGPAETWRRCEVTS